MTTKHLAVFMSCAAILLARAEPNARSGVAPKQASNPLLGGAVDYEQPKLLTGAIYEVGSEPLKVLFTFKRSAVRSGTTIRALREYFNPNGTLAAKEEVVYENGQLVSFKLDQVQSGAQGIVKVVSKENTPHGKELVFGYLPSGQRKERHKIEALRPDTLINDMIPAFISAHWSELMVGSAAKFRFIVLPRTETVGFKLVKQSETTLHGKPVVVLQMVPTSVVIAQLVAPILFTIEKNPPHRILQYQGRTTPQMKVGDKWKELDGLTVFNWP